LLSVFKALTSAFNHAIISTSVSYEWDEDSLVPEEDDNDVEKVFCHPSYQD
jgi:hypothetical protein